MCDSKAINLSYLMNAISRVVLLDTPRKGYDKVSAGLDSGQWPQEGPQQVSVWIWVKSVPWSRSEQAVSVAERSHVSGLGGGEAVNILM